MPRFGTRSSKRLETCTEDLITVFYDVVKVYDCTVLCGARGEFAQNEAFASGRSNVQWPDSTHNVEPPEQSDGIDAAPWPIPIDWGRIPWKNGTQDQIGAAIKELHKFYQFAGYVKGMGQMRGIEIRWGGDWDGDQTFTDQNFDDLVHFEILRR